MLAQAASVASRYAFGADGVGAARPGACGEADSPPRAPGSAFGAPRSAAFAHLRVAHPRSIGVERLQRLLMVLSSRRPIAPFRWKKRPHKRASARTPACGSAGTGHRAVQLCERWCTSSAWRASASAAR